MRGGLKKMFSFKVMHSFMPAEDWIAPIGLFTYIKYWFSKRDFHEYHVNMNNGWRKTTRKIARMCVKAKEEIFSKKVSRAHNFRDVDFANSIIKLLDFI